MRVLMLHLLVLLVGHEQRLCGHWLLWGTGRMLLVGGLLRNGCRCIRRVVNRLRHLTRWLSINRPAVLVMLWRLHRCW
jgi:hypothetical protein